MRLRLAQAGAWLHGVDAAGEFVQSGTPLLAVILLRVQPRHDLIGERAESVLLMHTQLRLYDLQCLVYYAARLAFVLR